MTTGTWRVRLWSALAVALASTVCAPAANGAAAGPLTLVGGDAARSIALEPCRAATGELSADQYGFGKGHICPGKTAAGGVTGALTLSLLNSTRVRVKLSVTYVSDRGRRLAVSRTSSPVSLIGAGGGGLHIGRYGLGVLRFSFGLSPGEPGSDLDGFLNIRARQRSHCQILSVPVHVPPPDGAYIHVDPSSVTLSTGTSPKRDRATVVMTGAGLPALLALQAAKSRTLTVSGASGRLATFTLDRFTVDSTDPYRATSTLVYSSADRGSYSGSVPVFTASPAAPRLTIGLDAGSPLATALWMVAIGAGAVLIVIVLAAAKNKKLPRLADVLACLAAVLIAGVIMWLVVHHATWGSVADRVAAVALGAAAAIVLVAGARALGPERSQPASGAGGRAA